MFGVLLVAVIVVVANQLFSLQAGTENPPATPADLSVVLAPFVALATAIERFWESMFDFYESVAIATARIIGVGKNTTAWVKAEAQNAESAVQTLVSALATAGTPDNPRY